MRLLRARSASGLEKGRLSAAPLARSVQPWLLELDRGAGLFELRLDLVGLFLSDPFLDRVRRAVDEVLGLLQAEARECADDLDHLDLLTARLVEDDVEGRLLLGRRGPVASGRSSCDCHRRGRGDAPLLLELVLEIDELEDGHAAQRLDELVGVRLRCHHCSSPSWVSWGSSAAGPSAAGSSGAGSSAAGSPAEASSAAGPSAAGSSAAGSASASVSGAASASATGSSGAASSAAGGSAVSPCSSSWRIRASITPTSSRIGAVNRPTIAVTGPATAPTSWARRTSAGGSFASCLRSSAPISAPSSRPPLSVIVCARTASSSAFATATGSPSVSRKAIAVGPSRRAR